MATSEARARPITESAVKRAVADYLRLRGFRVFTRSVGGAYNNGMQFVRFSEPGQSDLYGWQIGTARHMECEVKKPGARTNPKRDALQRAWLERARQDGVIALRVASVRDADQQLAEYGLPRRLLI